ncbi:alpha/beta hydrolase [Candidatus Thiothrix anitrata]|uniref:Alpha/beta fold hydrolase n=1 Tax=Candidatus Thiothrix anitrata TaxID=2823902 RepID=A0ABX7X7P2_9GAMM|nr:alpha/beta fold hydrolase [Candidatus Thiothrix anitrata]QTR50339.1 alpha/beta fold hydrolase [Candidatus Thiothrix anitrata]
MQKIIWLLLGGLVMVIGLGLAPLHQTAKLEAAVAKTLPNGAQFVPDACWFTNTTKLSVSCGWLHTAPAKPGAPSAFRLPVIIMRHAGLGHQPDPLVYLAGGPGSAAWLDKDGVEQHWLAWFEQKYAMKRDLILFDQRGTGMSEPALGCQAYRELSASVLANPGTPTENAQRYLEVSQQCQQQLTQAGQPLDQLGTHLSAQDVNDLLTLLDYQQSNLLGVSYGTRLALEIQRLFPERVRSLTLDSLYPPGEHLLRDWPELLDNSLQRLFHYCRTDERCLLENGDIETRYNTLMIQLRTTPLRIPVADLHLGNLQELQLNDEILLAMLFDAQYNSYQLKELPSFIRHLQEGRIDLARAYIDTYLYHQFDAAFREPVFWAVECRDNPSISAASRMAKVNAYPHLSYYLPVDYDMCSVWNKNPQNLGLSTNKERINTPSLILSGEDDPITPTAWAVKAAKTQFADETAYLFSFRGIAHSVLDSKPCASDLFIGFINDPTQRPRADCRLDKPRK